jgi:argininosuccinate lyase
VVAHAVKVGLSRGVDLADLPLDVLKTFHTAIEDDVYALLSLRGSLDTRQVQGGTAPARVREQIAAHKARLG